MLNLIIWFSYHSRDLIPICFCFFFFDNFVKFKQNCEIIWGFQDSVFFQFSSVFMFLVWFLLSGLNLIVILMIDDDAYVQRCIVPRLSVDIIVVVATVFITLFAIGNSFCYTNILWCYLQNLLCIGWLR